RAGGAGRHHQHERERERGGRSCAGPHLVPAAYWQLGGVFVVDFAIVHVQVDVHIPPAGMVEAVHAGAAENVDCVRTTETVNAFVAVSVTIEVTFSCHMHVVIVESVAAAS